MKFFLLHFALVPLLVFGKTTPTSGLIDSIKCKENPDVTYAIYLPSIYEINQSLPMVFFFEPAARATLPLLQYKTIADSLNIVLACSYNSKNGPVKPSLEAGRTSIDDILNKFKIDSEKIFLSGFSGGSRTAYTYALFSEKNYGVIGCGAGLPNLPDMPFPPPFRYALIVGDLDFNFYESLQVLDAFNAAKADIYYINFAGAHSWPPVEEFKRAVLYQLLNNTETKPVFKNKLVNLESKVANTYKGETNLIGYKWSLENLRRIEKLTSENHVYSDSVFVLIESKDYKRQLRQFEKIRKLEDSLVYEIYNAAKAIEITSYNIYTNHKPISWWHKKIDLFNKFKANENIHKSSLGERMLGQIGVMLWEFNRSMVELKLFDQALEMAEILIYLYPEAGSYLALKAEALSGKGDKDKATEIYRIAVQKGFDAENHPFLKNSRIIQKLNNFEKVKQPI